MFKELFITYLVDHGIQAANRVREAAEITARTHQAIVKPCRLHLGDYEETGQEKGEGEALATSEAATSTGRTSTTTYPSAFG